MGRRDGLLLRRREKRRRDGGRETLCRHRRLHHHSAGQEILQHRFRRVRQLREHMERVEPDVYEREALRRGGGGEHDPLRECQMGGLLQARRRGDDLGLHEAPGEQQNARHPRDRRGQDVLLRKRLQAGRQRGDDGIHRERKLDGSTHGAGSKLSMRERKPAVGLRRPDDLREQARRPLQLERIRGAGHRQLRRGHGQRGGLHGLRELPRLSGVLQGGSHLQGVRQPAVEL